MLYSYKSIMLNRLFKILIPSIEFVIKNAYRIDESIYIQSKPYNLI